MLKCQTVSTPLAARVRARDNNMCRCCESRHNLSIHHIVPRSQGGPDVLDNLVTLCAKCHDEIEVADYRSFAEIEGHDPDWKKPHLPVQDIEPSDPWAGKEYDWHLWVYGGSPNPWKCMTREQIIKRWGDTAVSVQKWNGDTAIDMRSKAVAKPRQPWMEGD